MSHTNQHYSALINAPKWFKREHITGDDIRFLRGQAQRLAKEIRLASEQDYISASTRSYIRYMKESLKAACQVYAKRAAITLSQAKYLVENEYLDLRD